jgi:hypothetical protein
MVVSCFEKVAKYRIVVEGNYRSQNKEWNDEKKDVLEAGFVEVINEKYCNHKQVCVFHEN